MLFFYISFIITNKNDYHTHDIVIKIVKRYLFTFYLLNNEFIYLNLKKTN